MSMTSDRNRWRSWLVLFAQATILGLAVAFVIQWLWPGRFAAAPPDEQRVARSDGVDAAPRGYRQAVAVAAPSVVNLYSNRVVANTGWRIFSDPLTQRSVQMPTLRPELRQGIGAGVIVRDDGIVLTNYHVVAEAQEILVGLHDGRVTSARVVGSDEETDLAVLQIAGAGFTAARFADPAHALAVGDVVLAIGNPFRIGQTVTLGIVSATGRDQPTLSRFEDFIQTDAAINTGNSGGALVNSQGELVGINTAQFGPGLGINFAIPASAAQRVLEAILTRGYVQRGWLGMEYVTSAETSSADLLAPRGVTVVAIAPASPADSGDVRAGDRLLSLNQSPILDEGDLRNREAAAKPGDVMTLRGTRNGIPFELSLNAIERPRRAP